MLPENRWSFEYLMSVVLNIAVPDGVVMATDSRSSFIRGGKRPQVFDGAQTVFVLHKDYPAAICDGWVPSWIRSEVIFRWLLLIVRVVVK